MHLNTAVTRRQHEAVGIDTCVHAPFPNELTQTRLPQAGTWSTFIISRSPPKIIFELIPMPQLAFPQLPSQQEVVAAKTTWGVVEFYY